jgi:ribosomal protein S12 methylthiotransferase accessory factor
MSETLADQLRAAAVLLRTDPKRTAAVPVLRAVGYDDGDTGAAADRARMLDVAAALRRLFRLPVPDAPGLTFFGGEADPAILGSHAAGLPVASLAGSGLDARRAFESCVGEGVEYLSQFADPSDGIRHGITDNRLNPPARDFIASVLRAVDADQREIAWLPVQRLDDGSAAWFPADLCLRRRDADFAPPLKLSTGCAAGRTAAAASLRGLLELIERDAAALWWRGGRRGRAIADDSPAGQAGLLLLDRLRQGQTTRTTWLLDITTDLGVPVVAALSAAADGFGLAFGLGCRTSLAEAARAAIFELCQVELGQHVIAAKRQESGDAALNDSDRKQLRRATQFDTRTCRLLRPDGAASPADLPDEPGAAIAAILPCLAAAGVTAYALDLTRPRFGVPVTRVLAPGLQLDPCEIVTPRLAAAMAETGGGAIHTGGIPLLG